MSAAQKLLEEKFAAVLAWERRKRWEQILGNAAASALLLALLLLPLNGYLPNFESRWFVVAALLLIVAPYFYYRQRWRGQDDRRALVQLDKALNLDERASTAWELAARGDGGATAELVYQQAQERLATIEPRTLLPRQWNWPAYTVLPLFALWSALLWFDSEDWFVERQRGPKVLAHQLRDYAREIQEKAKSESLRESLKAGQELEKLAQKNLAAKDGDEQLKKELAGAAQKLAAAGKSASDKNSFAAGESQQSLQDLKAELEAARDLFNDGAKGGQELPKQWMDRLAGLPQLKRQMDKQAQGDRGGGANELKAFLDRLNQQTTGELDRRALLDAQQYLEQMMQSGQGQKNQSNMASAARGEQEGAGDGEREKNYNNRPGSEPGKNDGGKSLPEFRGGAQTQVKSLIGAGDSSAVFFKGKPTTGKSELDQQEVVANYRRQAEQELNSERVPEALKETIRNYFMSLEKTRK
ncbi:MAG: hypothetical protein EXR70_07460 [Deltaproteobacteria bacterium]|nr:hypothetical protein [Deltaproteobacteria bacterium]